MPSKEDVASLLELALPKPSATTPAGVVALSLHCLMIREGFSTVETPGSDKKRKPSAYSPPTEWQVNGPNEWNFMYCRSDKTNRFVLHVNLHPTGSRIFVHASEEHNPNNIQILGLQLENYVPNPAKVKSHSWEGVLTNEELLTNNFLTYIVHPLMENSEDVVLSISPHNSSHLVQHPERMDDGTSRYAQYYHYWALTTGLVAAAATATALILSYKRRAAF